MGRPARPRRTAYRTILTPFVSAGAESAEEAGGGRREAEPVPPRDLLELVLVPPEAAGALGFGFASGTPPPPAPERRRRRRKEQKGKNHCGCTKPLFRKIILQMHTPRWDPQRVRMSTGERPIGAAKGKQPNTEALCQPPPPPSNTACSRLL